MSGHLLGVSQDLFCELCCSHRQLLKLDAVLITQQILCCSWDCIAKHPPINRCCCHGGQTPQSMWYMLPAQPATSSVVAPVVRPADGAEVYWCKSECAQLLLGTNATCVSAHCRFAMHGFTAARPAAGMALPAHPAVAGVAAAAAA